MDEEKEQDGRMVALIRRMAEQKNSAILFELRSGTEISAKVKTISGDLIELEDVLAYSPGEGWRGLKWAIIDSTAVIMCHPDFPPPPYYKYLMEGANG